MAGKRLARDIARYAKWRRPAREKGGGTTPAPGYCRSGPGGQSGLLEHAEVVGDQIGGQAERGVHPHPLGNVHSRADESAESVRVS